MTGHGFAGARAIVSLAVAAAMGAAALAQQTARDTPIKPTVGTSLVLGTVTDAASGKPLRRATVTISLSSTPMQRATATDDAGRFVFANLPAGSYSAPRVSKGGFVSATYGEKRIGGLGTPLVLADGQRLTIAIKLTRGAVITGALFDQGRPVPITSVTATPVRMVNGQPVAVSGTSGRGTTDDRGVYRLAGLAPGDYLVSSSPRLTANGDIRSVTDDEIQWAQRQIDGANATNPGPASAPPKAAQALAYAPVYFPGVTDVKRATVVTIGIGEERGGVDFSAQFVATSRVEGTIIGLDGQPALDAQVSLVNTGDALVGIGLDPIMMLEASMLHRPVVTSGKFSIAGVRPGTYTVSARASGQTGRAGGPAPMTLWATADVSVDGRDVSGVQLQLQRGMDLSGRIVFEGTTLPQPADLTRATVRLSGAPNANGVTVSINSPVGAVTADGTFLLQGVTPGRYFFSLSVPGIAAGPGTLTWMLKSIRAGDIDVADVPLEVLPSQGIQDILIRYTDQPSELSGTLLDSTGTPTSDLYVMLFSTDRSMWSSRSRRLRYPLRPGADGKFKFTGLPAGEYYLAALSDFEQADVPKPEFLDQVAAVAMKVTLGEGEKKTQDLKVAGPLR
ncbi:MAG TPA: carboxypeptidase-like regulatory domain-containing protein [Vicinamibacterales bacterium]|nr:carboxypeptidase-like regulatory domain-containing protein [Vicinamibacterales bacterium]